MAKDTNVNPAAEYSLGIVSYELDELVSSATALRIALDEAETVADLARRAASLAERATKLRDVLMDVNDSLARL